MFKTFFTFSRFTLLVALCISAIAAYYSIIGLTAIFAAAVIPIIIMGAILEIAKITTTVWLHRFWDRADKAIKIYLTTAVIALACLTSMGIFGLLSKAHLDQAVPSSDLVAKVELFDEKIKTQRDNIETSRKALEQLDAQVEQRLARGTSEAGAERAVQIRRQQTAERNRIQADIGNAQKEITKLNEEKAPIASQLRKVEAEVGPIKYIAALIYGDNPDVNTLERAVRWVIIMIVVVFDPLAIILILAANNSIKWEEEAKKAVTENQITVVPPDTVIEKDAVVEDIPVASPLANDIIPETKTDQEFTEIPEEKIINDSVVTTVVQDDVQDTVENEIVEDNDPFEWPELYNDYRNAKEEKGTKALPEETLPEIIAEMAASTDTVKDDAIVNQSTDIATEGVTSEAQVYTAKNGYVTYEGKQTSIEALRGIRPDLIIDEKQPQNNILFGVKFPTWALTGDLYVRTDVIPHRAYKFNGTRWIQIDKEQNTTYLQNIAYLQFLISKLNSGEYDIEMLTAIEQDEISDYLKRTV